jgi:divinyl protochlorophyllide a 8-vinyl-reductase
MGAVAERGSFAPSPGGDDRVRVGNAADPVGAPHEQPAGRIGPNAVTRLAEAITAFCGRPACERVFGAAGVARYLDHPPGEMVDERHVSRLHAALTADVGFPLAQAISADAGRRTGEYLLAHRIPRLAQAMLKRLPRALAARVLVAAIARHAWTFAGSGQFSYRFGPGLELSIRRSPVCRLLHTEAPACSYYAATFERVFAEMLGPRTTVTETACEAMGAEACRFSVSWQPGSGIRRPRRAGRRDPTSATVPSPATPRCRSPRWRR